MRTTGSSVGRGVGVIVAVGVGLGPAVIVKIGVGMAKEVKLHAHITMVMPNQTKFFFEFMRSL